MLGHAGHLHDLGAGRAGRQESAILRGDVSEEEGRGGQEGDRRRTEGAT